MGRYQYFVASASAIHNTQRRQGERNAFSGPLSPNRRYWSRQTVFGTTNSVHRRSLGVFSPAPLRVSRVSVPVVGYGHFVAETER